MPDYEKMYFQLAAAIANVISILIEVQQQGEKEYVEIETKKIPLTVLRSTGTGGDIF